MNKDIIKKDQTHTKSYLRFTWTSVVRELVTRLTCQDKEEKTQQIWRHILKLGLANEKPELKEINFENSAKSRTNSSETLMSLY